MKPDKTPCPSCGHLGLEIYCQMVTTDGFSLAGNQLKFSTVRRLRWKCPECEASGPAEDENEVTAE